VLLQKDPEGVSEVVNDINGELVNFWRVLSRPEWFFEFQRIIEATPFSEEHWRMAHEFHNMAQAFPAPGSRSEAVVSAVQFFILCRQSLAGRCKSFTGITKTRTRRQMNNEVSAWLTAIEWLPAVHERLKRVLILNRDALEVIRGQDGKQTCFYCDPPYLPATRTAPQVYRHEMTVAQHVELLHLLKQCVGKVALSGYRNDLYDDLLSGWTRHDFEIPNHAAGGKDKRVMTESVWCNY